MSFDYGIYVGSAFAITLFVFAFNLFFYFYESRKVKKNLQEYLKKQ